MRESSGSLIEDNLALLAESNNVIVILAPKLLATKAKKIVAKAEKDVAMWRAVALENSSQRDHATRHMMAARRERDAARASLAHVNGVAVEAQDQSAKLSAELDDARQLPVIATCQDCAHGYELMQGVACGHNRSPRLGHMSWYRETSEPPPAWCPLKGAER